MKGVVKRYRAICKETSISSPTFFKEKDAWNWARRRQEECWDQDEPCDLTFEVVSETLSED